MAEEEKNENESGEETEELDPEELASKAKKKTMFLGGGVLGLVVVGYLLMLMAIPSDGESELVPYEGPFVVPLADSNFQVNLAGKGRRFLSMSANIEYEGYDEAYVTGRVADLVYLAQLKDVLITLGSQKAAEELEDSAGKAIFKQELQSAINELLFPLHLGEGGQPGKADEDSGLAPGLSFEASTYRAGIMNGRVHIDALERTIRLDDADPIRYEGHESDLRLETPAGQTLFVDVTRITPEFQGEVAVGVHGKIEKILWDEFLLQ